jgi:hypothetical protein
VIYPAALPWPWLNRTKADTSAILRGFYGRTLCLIREITPEIVLATATPLDGDTPRFMQRTK